MVRFLSAHRFGTSQGIHHVVRWSVTFTSHNFLLFNIIDVWGNGVNGNLRMLGERSALRSLGQATAQDERERWIRPTVEMTKGKYISLLFLDEKKQKSSDSTELC